MKLSELFEEHEEDNPISQEEFDALQAPSPQNISGKFKVGNVAFNNRTGFGSTPNNAEVNYFGFTMFITPSIFLRFAAQGDRSGTAEKFVKLIKDRVPMGSPTLYISTDLETQPIRIEVVGHEGRARMAAIGKIEPNVKIPVHVIIRGGYRARHLSKEFFDALRDIGMVPEDLAKATYTKSEPRNAHVGRIFWDGKEV